MNCNIFGMVQFLTIVSVINIKPITCVKSPDRCLNSKQITINRHLCGNFTPLHLVLCLFKQNQLIALIKTQAIRRFPYSISTKTSLNSTHNGALNARIQIREETPRINNETFQTISTWTSSCKEQKSIPLIVSHYWRRHHMF